MNGMQKAELVMKIKRCHGGAAVEVMIGPLRIDDFEFKVSGDPQRGEFQVATLTASLPPVAVQRMVNELYGEGIIDEALAMNATKNYRGSDGKR